MGDDVARDERCQCFCTKVAEWRMGGNGSFVRRKWGEGWEVTEHLYEGNGTEDGRERSICTKETERRMGGNGSFVRCGLRKVYRLSENTL